MLNNHKSGKISLVTFLGIIVSFYSAVQNATINECNHPFPVAIHNGYYGAQESDTLTINSKTVKAFYDVWKKKYLKNDSQGRLYVKNDEKHEHGITTSEAIGYGMMIEALIAGYDPEAHMNFDKLYAYALFNHTTKTKDMPLFSTNLMGWKQFKNTGKNANDSAVDGDLDIAYALLLAHEQWDKEGHYYYLDAAKMTLKAIKEQAIDTLNLKVQRGNSDHYFASSYGHNIIRMSDFMPSHLRSFYYYTKEPLWKNLLEANYNRYELVQAKFSPTYGLFPDYIYEPNSDHFSLVSSTVPKDTIEAEGLNDGGGFRNFSGENYGYNSCRIPWRIALDYLLNNNAEARKIIDKMNIGIENYADNNACLLTNVIPLKDDLSPALHTKTITALADTDSADLNIVAPFGVAAMITSNSAWRHRLYQLIIDKKETRCDNNKKPKKRIYYENTIRLISLIIISYNYWAPEKQFH